MTYCKECLSKQQKINELEEEISQLKTKLHYQERTAEEGFFGSSTPSSEIPINFCTRYGSPCFRRVISVPDGFSAWFCGFLGWSKFVSACVERDKKMLKNLIFAFAVPALLTQSRSVAPKAEAAGVRGGVEQWNSRAVEKSFWVILFQKEHVLPRKTAKNLLI